MMALYRTRRPSAISASMRDSGWGEGSCKICSVMRGHSRSKNGVLSHAYDPRIQDEVQRARSYCQQPGRRPMDCRVEPGNDGGEVVSSGTGYLNGLLKNGEPFRP